MKRTKTFVTKFLSVLALGAVVLSSCTKDLEDRLDKVEATLEKVVSDAASLKTELDKMSAKKDVTLVGTTDAATKKTTLTFTDATGKVSTIIFDGINDGNTPPDGNDKAVVTVVPDATTGMTTVTVDGKAFTYPTTIPAHISEVKPLHDDVSATAGTTFEMNFYINSNDVISAIAKTNASVIYAYATKTAIESAAEFITVESITAVADSKNEFVVKFNAIKDIHDTAFRLGIAQAAGKPTVYSEPFYVNIAQAPKVNTIGYSDATATAASLMVTNGKTTQIARSSSITSPTIVGKEYFATSEATNNAISHASIINRTYEVYKVDASILPAQAEDSNSLLSVVGNFNIDATKAEFDAIAKKISDEVAKTTGSKLVAAQDHLAVTFEKGKVTLKPDYTKVPANQAKYFVVMKGQIAGGNYFIYGTIVETNNTKLYLAKDLASVLNATANNILTQVDYAYTGATYPTMTGLNNMPSTAETFVDVYDIDGNKMNSAPNNIKATTKLNELNYIVYNFKLGAELKLVAGKEYLVNVKHIYADGKSFTIQHKLMAAKPTVTLVAKTPVVSGYSFTAATNKILVNSHKSFSSADNLNVDKTITIASAMGTPKVSFSATGIVSTDNYKVFYRAKTTVDGEVVYFDGIDKKNDELLTSDAPATAYTVAEVEAAAVLAMDKEYDMDIVIVYTDGNREVKAGKIEFATAKFTGFKLNADSETTAKHALTIANNATTTLDLSYVKNAANSKPFFFAASTNQPILWLDETKPAGMDADSYIKMLNGVVYTIAELTPEQKANITNGDAVLTEAEATALKSLIEFKEGPAQTMSLTSTANALAKGEVQVKLPAGYKLKADLVQTIEAKVTDYLGREVKLSIDVTITK